MARIPTRSRRAPSPSSGGAGGHLARINTLQARILELEKNHPPPGPVNVNSLADLPEPGAEPGDDPDEIRLDPTVIYKWGTPIDLGSDVLVATKTFWLGTTSFLSSITTNSAKPLLRITGDGATPSFTFITGMAMVNLGGGSVLDVGNGDFGAFVMDRGTCFSLGAGLAVRDSAAVTFDSMTFQAATDSVLILGDIEDFQLTTTILSPAPGAPAWRGFRVDDSATINNCFVHVVDFRNVSASDKSISVSASATLNRPLRLNASSFSGPGDFVDPLGLQKTDPGFITDGSLGVESSVFAGRLFINGNTSQATVIDVGGTFVNIGNGNASHPVYALSAASERFELDGATAATQGIKCTSLEAHKYEIKANLTMVKAAGTDQVSAALYIDGVQQADSVTQIEVTSNGSRAVISETIASMSADEIITVKITSAGGSDVTVENVSIVPLRL